MRSHTPIALLAIIALAASVPITPAAPEYQRLVERMRYEGMAEVYLLSCRLKHGSSPSDSSPH